jgi:protein FRG1
MVGDSDFMIYEARAIFLFIGPRHKNNPACPAYNLEKLSLIHHTYSITRPFYIMVKPLSFKGDKKSSKKRKRATEDRDASTTSSSQALVPSTSTTQPTTSKAPEDDSWVSAEAPLDISGPVVFVLPTEPPSALASDALGKIFSIPIENIVDQDPNTSEPHDVRQVWVANRVAGSTTISFKGHHSKYLGCDKSGVLSATRDAVGREEGFEAIVTEAGVGTFGIMSAYEKFVGIDPDATGDRVVRGDKEAIEFVSTIRIRMQARFKTKLRVAKEEKAREKISRRELEELAGRKLEDDDVKKLKRARREGNFHEALLDVKVKGKHDKFS